MTIKKAKAYVDQERKRLTKKKAWTVHDIGVAQLLNLAYMTQQSKENKHPPKFMIDREEVAARYNTAVKTYEDKQIYQRYLTIHYGLAHGYNLAQAQLQQFFHGYYKSSLTMSQYRQAESIRLNEHKQPVIVTKPQLKALKAEIVKTRGKAPISLLGAIYHQATQYANNPEKAPSTIREVIERYRQEECTYESILGGYYNALSVYEYELPSGEKRKDMTPGAWRRAYWENYARFLGLERGRRKAETVVKNHYAETMKHCRRLYFEGEEAAAAEAERVTRRKPDRVTRELFYTYLRDILSHDTNPAYIDQKKYNLTLDDFGKPIPDNHLEEILKAMGLCSDMIVKVKPGRPDHLYKIEVLQNTHLLGFYDEASALIYVPWLLTNKENPESRIFKPLIEKGRKKFIRDFGELYNAIRENLIDRIPGAAAVEDDTAPVFTWGELGKLGLEFFNEIRTVTPMDITLYLNPSPKLPLDSVKVRRWHSQGIAVLENSRAKEYKHEAARPYTLMENLEQTAQDPKKIQEIQEYTDIIINPAVSFLLAYNRIIQALAKVFEIPALELMTVDIEPLEEKVKEYNDNLAQLYLEAGEGYPMLPDKKGERRQELVKQLFKRLDIEPWRPKEEQARYMEKVMAERGAISAEVAGQISDLLPLIQLIMTVKEG
jgi:hypothetical protein